MTSPQSPTLTVEPSEGSMEEYERQIMELGYGAMCGDKIAGLVLKRLGEAKAKFLKEVSRRFFEGTDAQSTFILPGLPRPPAKHNLDNIVPRAPTPHVAAATLRSEQPPMSAPEMPTAHRRRDTPRHPAMNWYSAIPASVTFLPLEPRFDCPHCGPTNHFMGLTTDGVEMRFCVPCHPELAQRASMMPHTKP